MYPDSTVFLRDSATPHLRELSAILNRFGERLSPSLVRKVFERLPGLVEMVELGDGLFQVVSLDLNGGSAPAGDDVLEFQLTERFRDLLSALRALDLDLEGVCQRHGLFPASSSLNQGHVKSCADCQGGGV